LQFREALDAAALFFFWLGMGLEKIHIYVQQNVMTDSPQKKSDD
jgi:hypothetical protein